MNPMRDWGVIACTWCWRCSSAALLVGARLHGGGDKSDFGVQIWSGMLFHYHASRCLSYTYHTWDSPSVGSKHTLSPCHAHM